MVSNLKFYFVIAAVVLSRLNADGLNRDLCSSLDPTTRQIPLKTQYFKSDEERASSSIRTVEETQLTTLLSTLEDPNPEIRINTVVKLDTLSKDLARNLRSMWTKGLKEQLYKEKNVYVISAILKCLFSFENGSELALELPQLVGCDRDEPLREIAIDLTIQTSDGWHLDTFTRLWQKHPTPSNQAKIYPFAMKLLTRGVADAYDLLLKIGKPPTVEEIDSIYNRNKLSLSANRNQMLRLLERLGGPTYTSTIKEEFQNETDPKRKRELAQLILESQLEPGKPEYADHNDLSCVPKEEILAKRLPYIETEINRLLQSDNTKYFELSSLNHIHPVLFSFDEWGSSLGPKDRIKFWDQVLSIIPKNSKWSKPLQQLALAHVSNGGQLMLTDKQSAKKEIQLAESLSKDLSMGTDFPGILENIKHWIERKSQPPLIDENDLIGKYQANRLFEGYTLILKEENKYEFTAGGDVINFCPVKPTQGEYSVEGRYLLLKPGPHLAIYGIESPEFLVPVIWGKNVFLLSDSYAFDGILEFCNLVNSSEKESLETFKDWNYHKTGDKDSQDSIDLTGIPSLPEEWKDCILDEPLKPEVIKVEEKSSLVVNMGKDEGLRVGMKLYLDNSALPAVWKISEVSAKQSHAVPYGEVPVIIIGEKLSTRIPE